MASRRKGSDASGPLVGGTRAQLRTFMWCPPCGAHHAANCSFLLGGKESCSYDERQIALRNRIRALTPRLNQRERALFGLVWLQLDMLDDITAGPADWVLAVLSTLVAAFETVEAPTTPEPP